MTASSSDEELSESGRLENFPHPRRVAQLTGHDAAMAEFAAALRTGRMHHAWLLSGPQGIGKATLAFRMARAILKYGAGSGVADDLAMSPDDPVFRKITALSHPDFLLLRRPVDKSGRLQGVLPVEEIRKAASFFALSAGEGGWRVCVIDSADDMNISAANALLKILEEPPRNAMILLISHAPGRLLPTIRSRCRKLALRPLGVKALAEVVGAHFPDLSPDDFRLVARLSDGAPGRALALAHEDGLRIYREMTELLLSLPAVSAPVLHGFAERLARPAAEQNYETMTRLLTSWLARMIRDAAAGGIFEDWVAGEAALMRRLMGAATLEQWAVVWENTVNLLRRADSVNLGRKQVILSIFSSLAQTAGGSRG